MRKIVNGIYDVGVLDPNLRIFDVIMKTEFGTSYNAYIVKGSEKTALIETVHKSFFSAYIEQIEEIVDLSDVDYLVMNHNEPDHSGSIAQLLQRYPNITVLASQAGCAYLKNIVNLPGMQIKTVRDGDTVSLGDKTLQFLIAPFLHWPDSMFTWVPEEKVLFSCDFLGTHYCEPQLLDERVVYPEYYWASLQNYYDAIFAPFGAYVTKGLDKISGLDIRFACPSHGPVLTKEGFLPEVIRRYRNWCRPARQGQTSIPIFYCSAYGNTAQLAEAIAKGIREVLPHAAVECFNIIEHNMEALQKRLNESTAFLLGSPTINRDALSPLWVLLAHVDAIRIPKRPAAVFGSYGWSGEATGSLAARLQTLKADVFEKQFRIVFVPTEEDLVAAREFGKEFAAATGIGKPTNKIS